MSDSDQDLLRQFVHDHSQDAFTALVQRHVNLVYSAALRQVRSPQLAEDIAQSVFADLARNAEKLTPANGGTPVLAAWLYAVTRRTAIDAIRKESRRQLREQIAVEMTNMKATENNWAQIEPLLDDAMAALDETDRSAILLRYFENKNLREVGEALGTSDDAAQKRVSRAVEQLRDFFSKRNVTTGASGLAVLISANAVQSAPLGLAATISASAFLAGTAVHASTIIAATKTIAMTTLQKALVTVTVAVLAGAGIYEAHQAAQLRDQNQTLGQAQAPLAEQNLQLQVERDDATNRLADLAAEISRLKSNPNEMELLKLRGEVGQLRQAKESGTKQPPPVWEPLDISKIQDSMTEVKFSTATNVGTATPAALLQTWLWALQYGDAEALNGVWDFPSEMTEAEKLRMIQAAIAYQSVQRANANGFEHYRLVDLLPLGNDKYFALISEASPLFGNAAVMKKVFRQIGGEWKMYLGPPTYSPTNE